MLSKTRSFPIYAFFIIPTPPPTVNAPPDVELLLSTLAVILIPPLVKNDPVRILLLVVVLFMVTSPFCIINGDCWASIVILFKRISAILKYTKDIFFTNQTKNFLVFVK